MIRAAKIVSIFILLSVLSSCDEINLTEGDAITGSSVIVTEGREVTSNFTAIEISNAIQARYQQNENPSIEVTADDNVIPFVITEIESGVLFVELDNGSFNDITVEVVITHPEINEMSVASASSLTVEEISVPTLSINVSEASRMEVAGNATTVTLNVSEASRFRGFDLDVENYIINISSASDVELSCTETLSGSISSASSVTYAGNPAIDIDVSGASTFSARD